MTARGGWAKLAAFRRGTLAPSRIKKEWCGARRLPLRFTAHPYAAALCGDRQNVTGCAKCGTSRADSPSPLVTCSTCWPPEKPSAEPAREISPKPPMSVCGHTRQRRRGQGYDYYTAAGANGCQASPSGSFLRSSGVDSRPPRRSALLGGLSALVGKTFGKMGAAIFAPVRIVDLFAVWSVWYASNKA